MNNLTSEEASINFIDDIYIPCVEKCKTQNIQKICSALSNGTAVLDNEEKCDQYIAAYGGHHFYKLYEAFNSTKFQYADDKELEIIDWGCGQALATCALVNYFVENKLRPKITSITLVDPSPVALGRGHNFIREILGTEFCTTAEIYRINKYLGDLEPSDFVSESNRIKVHLFSNIIDVETVDISKLHELIIKSFRGLNRFICTSPDNEHKHRLDEFYTIFSQSHEVYNSIFLDEPIYKNIFYFKFGRHEKCRIGRCERQFSASLT